MEHAIQDQQTTSRLIRQNARKCLKCGNADHRFNDCKEESMQLLSLDELLQALPKKRIVQWLIDTASQNPFLARPIIDGLFDQASLMMQSHPEPQLTKGNQKRTVERRKELAASDNPNPTATTTTGGTTTTDTTTTTRSNSSPVQKVQTTATADPNFVQAPPDVPVSAPANPDAMDIDIPKVKPDQTPRPASKRLFRNPLFQSDSSESNDDSGSGPTPPVMVLDIPKVKPDHTPRPASKRRLRNPLFQSDSSESKDDSGSGPAPPVMVSAPARQPPSLCASPSSPAPVSFQSAPSAAPPPSVLASVAAPISSDATLILPRAPRSVRPASRPASRPAVTPVAAAADRSSRLHPIHKGDRQSYIRAYRESDGNIVEEIMYRWGCCGKIVDHYDNTCSG